MKEFRIEIFGYIDLQAENRRDAMTQVKEKFESGELTYVDLSFEITYEEGEEE